MKEGHAVFAFFSFLLLLHFVSATFSVDVNTSNVKKSYNLGDQISGTIVISFDNESFDSALTTNLGTGSTNVGSWLKQAGKREKQDYNCSFEGCMPSYEPKGSVSAVNIFIQQPQNFGFKASGANVSVSSLSFAAKSSLPNSCSKPFSIDVLDTDQYTLENYRYNGRLCPNIKNGCFDSSLNSGQYQLANLGSSGYCERIRLDPAPAYLFGANLIRPNETESENISMQLYDATFTTYYGSCTFLAAQQNNSCIIPYPIAKQANYSVCILSNKSNSPSQIKTEFSDQICGTTNLGQSSTRDFDIFARALEYDSDYSLFDGDSFALLNDEQNFKDILNQYLNSEYRRNCVNRDCFIPFKLIGEAQQVAFNNISFVYESDGVTINDNVIYAIERNAPTIKSGKMTIALEAAHLNVSQKNTVLQINLGNRTLFRMNINITSIPVRIEPTFALIGVPTTFSVVSNEAILSATWKFSDDTTIQQGLRASHSFASAGTYSVDVTALAAGGNSYIKTQQVLVGEPRASAEELLKLTEQSIISLSGNMKNIPVWLLPPIENHLPIVQINNSLAQTRAKLQYASNDTEYVQIIQELQALNVPVAVGIIRTGQFPLISAYGNINLDYANNLYQTEQDPEQLKSAILAWTRDKYDANIEMSSYGTSSVNGESDTILTKVKIAVNPKDQSDDAYLIVDYPIESLHFITGYSGKEIQGGTYIPLQNANSIEFYVEEEMAIDDLGVYILPSIENLQSQGYSYELARPPSERQNSVFYVSLGILILFLIIAATALQYWYRKHYELYLFPQEESLFNIMTFIYNAKKKGLKEGNIRKILLNSGWKREQINYATGKFEGKIFGLFGLPLYSAHQEEKIKGAIEARQKQNTGRKVY